MHGLMIGLVIAGLWITLLMIVVILGILFQNTEQRRRNRNKRG